MSLKVDLIELMESKILIVVLSVIMFIGLAMITLSYSTIENGVLIKNLTVNDITVSEITINDSVVSTTKFLIRPETIDKQLEIYARFKSEGAKNMSIYIQNISGKGRTLTCSLEALNSSKRCLVIAYIKNNSVSCVCDSYDDFND